MTEEQKNVVIKRRNSGFGYASIAKEIGLTKDAVVAFCRRNGLTGNRTGKAPEGSSYPTAIPDGNTALTPVILTIGLEVAGQMTEEQFRAEKLYYISLSIAKSMLEKGVIDEEVLAIIDTKLLEKYRPISGTLLAGKPPP